MKNLIIGILVVIGFFGMILLGVIIDTAFKGDLVFAPNFQLGDGSRTEPSNVITYGPVIIYTISVGLIVYLKSKKKQRAEAKEKAEERRKIENAPIKTASVTVISKLHEKSVSGVEIIGTEHSYYIVFGFPNNRRQKFAVDKEQYALVREGETGDFSYKQLENGILFVRFKPHENKSEDSKWACPYCSSKNFATELACGACGARRQG